MGKEVTFTMKEVERYSLIQRLLTGRMNKKEARRLQEPKMVRLRHAPFQSGFSDLARRAHVQISICNRGLANITFV